MGYKMCSKVNCNKLIPINKRYCKAHELERIEDIKLNNRFYSKNRTDIRELNFYKSYEWELVKKVITNMFKGICLYTYYTSNEIVKADVIHHIEELKESWDKRLDVSNLIPLSKAAHNKIYGAYKNKKDKADMQKYLYELIIKYKSEF